MPKPRPQIHDPWSEDEIHRFLAAHRTGSMGTIDAVGYPHVLPMWHTLLDGRVWISFRIPKAKYSNLRRDPRMSYTVDAGESFAEYHGVMIRGEAEFVEEPDLLARYHLAWAYRHFGRDDDPYLLRITAGPRCVIRLRPEHVFTWDHRRLTDQTVPTARGRP